MGKRPIASGFPGFWLPDGKGGIVRTAAYPGKILLVYLFAADDLDAARTLPVLEAVQLVEEERAVLVVDHGIQVLEDER